MSSSPADLVREFHLAFGLDARTTPTEVAPELAAHRGELLAEEAAEVAEVAVTGPLDRLAHELADVVYVAYGTALVHGIDLHPANGAPRAHRDERDACHQPRARPPAFP